MIAIRFTSMGRLNIGWTNPVVALSYRKYLFEGLPDPDRNDDKLIPEIIIVVVHQ